MRRLPLLVLVALSSGLVVAGSPVASAAIAAPVLIRDVNTGRLDVTIPDPTTAHPEVIQPDTQIEPSIAVNPANNQNVVAAYQEGRVAGGGDMTNGWSTTFDGGQTWSHGHFPCLTYNVVDAHCPNGNLPDGSAPLYDRASDAVVAFGPDNTVYANHLDFDDSSGAVVSGLRSAIGVNVSRNGGSTWSVPVFLQDDQGGGLNDKNWIVVDNSDATGHHKGRVYVVWDRIATIDYNYCDANCDVRTNWLPNFLVLYGGQGISAVPLVLPSGNLGVIFNTDASAPVYTLPPRIPTDQPANATNITGIDIVIFPVAGALPVPLSSQVPRGVTDDKGTAIRQQRASDGTLIDAEVDQASGQIYVVWADGRSRADGVNDAYIVSSTDGGLTWGPPARINPGSSSDFVNHYNVTVAVGPDGDVRVAYRQRQEAATVAAFSPNIDTYYQESHDHGATWSKPLRVNTVRTNVYYGAFSRNGIFEGDYNEIAAAGPFSYIVREEAYAVTPNEPHGLMSSGDTLTGNTAGCPNQTLTPSCMTHIHQRNWVAVVGPGQGTATAAVPSGVPTVSPLALDLPTTSAALVNPTVWALFAAGVATLLLVVSALWLLARRRA